MPLHRGQRVISSSTRLFSSVAWLHWPGLPEPVCVRTALYWDGRGWRLAELPGCSAAATWFPLSSRSITRLPVEPGRDGLLCHAHRLVNTFPDSLALLLGLGVTGQVQ